MLDFDNAREKIVSNLSDYFPTEFVNRIDKVVVFNPLDKNLIKKIVKLQLDELINRLQEKYITLTYNTKVLSTITKKVYNPAYGAREVRRFIINNIEDKIAEFIINNTKKSNQFEITIEKDEVVVK
jgi:ATP-dependent Clp protease ATP-binding subunit ClpA